MQSGEEGSRVFFCREANCGRMFEELDQYNRHLKQRHNKTSSADDQSTVAQSLATEVAELNHLVSSVETLTHNIKDQEVSDDAIYARSILEIELENSKKNKKSSVTFEVLQEAKEQLTEDFIIQKAQGSPENEGSHSLELLQVLQLNNMGLCFFDKTDHFNPDSLRELRVLDISGNRLLSLTGMAHLFNIESLDVSNNCISSLEGLEECTTLKNLTCNNNFIETCTELRHLKKLKTLQLADNKLKNLEEVIGVVQELSKLKELSMKGNPVKLSKTDRQASELQA